MPVRPIWTLAVVVCLSGAVLAETKTLRFDLPTQPLEIFGLSFSADFLGPTRGTVIKARAELEFTTDETFDASEIQIIFQPPSEGLPIWRLVGADLGWDGAGTFTASLSTDALNGVIDLGEPEPDFSLFLVDLRVLGRRPLGGRFTDSFFEVDIAESAAGVLPGDANLDGRRNIADAVAVLRRLFLADRTPPPCQRAPDDPANVALLDGNGDGRVDVSDVVHLPRRPAARGRRAVHGDPGLPATLRDRRDGGDHGGGYIGT